jgi:hypothetical protein
MAGFASITVKGADQISAQWKKTAAAADAESYKLTRMYTQLLTTSVKAHASGRPGPRTPTGDYRRSITGDVERKAGSVVGTVGTTRPQGRRLELGFAGTDSLGRHYNQPPYPHFRPALSKIEEAYTLAIGGIVRNL